MSRNRFIGFTARVLMAVAGGLLILAYLSVYVNPAKAWLLVPLEILFWPLLLLNLFLLVWAIARRSKALFIPLAALLPALFVTGRFIQLRGAGDAADDSHTVKVVTYNVGRFSSDDKTGNAACRDSVFAFLRRCDADIICLQEFYQKNSSKTIQNLAAALLRGYTPTYYLYTGKNGRFGNVILSRYPIRGKGHLEFDSSVNLAVWADYRIGDRTVRVYNCHLESYNISPAKMYSQIRSRENNDVLLEDTGRKVRKSIRQRSTQVDQIFNDIDNSPVESIICGDFNDSPLSYTYHKTTRGHRDAFIDAGKGFGASYPCGIPLVRLDYVLYPLDMRAVSYSCPRTKYSDHRPVITEIQF